MQHASVLSGRQMMMLVVVGLHAVVIGVLMTMKLEFVKPPALVFKSITPVTEERKPPIDRPELVVNDKVPVLWVPDLPPPVVRTEPQRAITPEPAPPMPPSDTTGASGAERFAIPPTELIWRATRPTDDFYPASSISMGEEGVSVVRVCVGPTGRIEGRPAIRTSSRSRRLDDAAVRWASEALEFTPATRNGAAVQECKDFRVLFNLR